MVIIVGALKVGIKDTDIIRINVYFAGGINLRRVFGLMLLLLIQKL